MECHRLCPAESVGDAEGVVRVCQPIGSGRKGLPTLSGSFQLGCTEAPVNKEWSIKIADFLPLESINNVKQ